MSAAIAKKETVLLRLELKRDLVTEYLGVPPTVTMGEPKAAYLAAYVLHTPWYSLTPFFFH